MFENGDDNEENDDDEDNDDDDKDNDDNDNNDDDDAENDELTRQVVAAVGICWDGFHSLSLQVLPTPPCCCTWKKSNKNMRKHSRET